MKIRGKRVLKNGAIAGYVYYSKDRKWKWRIIGRAKKGGSGKGKTPNISNNSQRIGLSNLPNNNQIVTSWNKEKNHLNLIINKQLRKKNVSSVKKNGLREIKRKLNERHNNPNYNSSDNLNEIFMEIIKVSSNGINKKNMNKLVELRSERHENEEEMKKIINLNLSNNENRALGQLSEYLNEPSNITNQELKNYLDGLENLNNDSGNNSNATDENFNELNDPNNNGENHSGISNQELKKFLNNLNNE